MLQRNTPPKATSSPKTMAVGSVSIATRIASLIAVKRFIRRVPDAGADVNWLSAPAAGADSCAAAALLAKRRAEELAAAAGRNEGVAGRAAPRSAAASAELHADLRDIPAESRRVAGGE